MKNDDEDGLQWQGLKMGDADQAGGNRQATGRMEWASSKMNGR